MLREYEVGQRLRAADVNAFVRTSRAVLLGDGVGDADSFSNSTSYRELPEIQFKNLSAQVCPQGGIMKPGSYTASGTRAIQITRPDDTYVWRYLVSMSGPTPLNGYGWARWMFEYASDNVALFGVDPSSGSYSSVIEWGPKKDDWALWPQRPGFLLQDTINATSKLGRVVQRIPPLIIGHAVEAIETGEMKDVTVFGGPAGSEVTLEYIVPDCFNKGPAINEDDEVTVSLVNGQPYVALLACGD